MSFTDCSCPDWLYGPVPLGQDGLSGPIPLSWSHKSELIWATRTKEHLQRQLGISQEEPWYVRFGPYEGAQLVHVCDVICLQSLGLSKPEERKEHIGMSCKQKHQFLIFYPRKSQILVSTSRNTLFCHNIKFVICSLVINKLLFFFPS